jgi:hypothetical protein
MLSNFADAREVTTLVPMVKLLRALGFAVNEHTRRCACTLHRGSNQSAFAWREDGRWHCFSCGAGNDRITLVRAARNCSFREAVNFLARLAGVRYSPQRCSPSEGAQLRARWERAERAAWRIRDELVRLRGYYADGLHRAERLWRLLGGELLRAGSEAEREAAWERLSQLAPVCLFYFAAWNFIWGAKPDALARLALASGAARRALIFGERP